MKPAAWIPSNASSHVSHHLLGKFRTTSTNNCLQREVLFSVRLLDLFCFNFAVIKKAFVEESFCDSGSE